MFVVVAMLVAMIPMTMLAKNDHDNQGNSEKTITVSVGDIEGGVVSPSSINIKKNSQLKVSNNTLIDSKGSVLFTANVQQEYTDNIEFKYWSKTQDGSDKVSSGEEITSGDGNATVYAIFGEKSAPESKNGFYFGNSTEALEKGVKVEGDDETKLLYYNNSADPSQFSVTVNGKEEKNLLFYALPKSEGTLYVVETEGNTITLSENSPEKGTGFYVGEKQLKKDDIVYKNDVIKFYKEGKHEKFKVTDLQTSEKYQYTATDNYKVTRTDSDKNHGEITLSATAIVVEEPTLVDGPLTYDGTPQDLIDSEGEVESGTLYYAVSDEEPSSNDVWKANAEEIAQIDAGEYTVWYKVVGASGYLNVDPKEIGTITIQKATIVEEDLSLASPDNGEELDYKGETVTPVVELVNKQFATEYLDIVVKDKKGKAVKGGAYLPGTYYVYVGVKDSENFNEIEPICVGSFTIDDVKVVVGDKGKFTEGSDGTLTFKTNGPFNKEAFKDVQTRTTSRYFNGIEVDGFSVDPKAYTVKEGSTLVTLSNDYLKTLRTGKHTITFVYDGGNVTAEATFTVEAAQESPKTADANTTWLWIFLSVLGGLAIIAGAYKTIGSDI